MIYPLTPYSVSKVPAKIGVYCLGNIENKKFVVRYVGRDDVDIQRRLKEHITAIKGNDEPLYTHFKYLVCSTADEAYRLECKAYHSNRLEIDNKIHPAKPENDKNAHCPNSACPYYLN